MRNGIIGVCALALVATVALCANEKAPADFQQAMKDNGAALMKVGKDVEAKDYDAIAASAATLKKGFMGPVGKYFTTTKMDDALAKCKEAYTASDNLEKDRKSTRLNSSHIQKSRMPSSA